MIGISLLVLREALEIIIRISRFVGIRGCTYYAVYPVYSQPLALPGEEIEEKYA